MRRQQIKEQGSKIKKTIEKTAGILPIGSGTAHDTKAANQSACPDNSQATFSASSTSSHFFSARVPQDLSLNLIL